MTADNEMMPQHELRKGGIVRVTTDRDVECACSDCGAVFASTGCGASHARAARHRVEVSYSSRFVFIPAETIASAVSRSNPAVPPGTEPDEQHLDEQPDGAQ